MIFVPEKEKCASWNELNEGIYILYFPYVSETTNCSIQFFWNKTKKYDPFYLTVRYCLLNEVLKCGFPCENYPQLRYNKVINKWFCTCPSSMISVFNTDEDELKFFETNENIKINQMNEKHGFFNDPIKSILYWNKECAKSVFDFCNEKMKEIDNVLQ